MEWWKRANLYGYPPDITDERCLCMHKAGSRGEEIRYAAFDYSTSLRTLLPKVKVPTLLIASSKDALAPVQKDVQQMIPGSKLVEIKDGGVYVTRTMPKEFAECILNFL
jgi:pimeloyl-ACP methyl ester carboxylesterase